MTKAVFLIKIIVYHGVIVPSWMTHGTVNVFYRCRPCYTIKKDFYHQENWYLSNWWCLDLRH